MFEKDMFVSGFHCQLRFVLGMWIFHRKYFFHERKHLRSYCKSTDKTGGGGDEEVESKG